MYKFPLLYALMMVFFATSSLSAQSAKEDGTFSAAAILGVNLAQIDGDAELGFNKVGLNVGGRVGVSFTKNFETALEILFAQKGSQSKKVTGYPRNLQCNLNYIEIPLEFSYKDWQIFDKENNTSYMRLQFAAGISYSRLMGGKLLTDGMEQDMDRFKDNEFMMRFGGTVYFTRNWGLNILWARSISSITDSNNNGGWGNAVNRMITVRAMYRF